MAEERTPMTPVELAEYLRNYVGQQTSGARFDYDALRQIQQADNIDEAVRLVEQYRLFTTEAGFPGWWQEAVTAAAVYRTETGEYREGPLIGDEERPDDPLADTDLTSLHPTLQAQIELNPALLDTPEALSALNAIYLQGDEKVQPVSSLLFPNLPGGDPNPVVHLQMMADEDYSPYAPYRSREQTVDIMERMYFETPQEQNYWVEQYQHALGYASGDELLIYSGLGPETRARLERKYVDAGLLEAADDGTLNYVPGEAGMPQLLALRAAMMRGTYEGVGFEVALEKMMKEKTALEKFEGAVGSGISKPSFSVPASLRKIPDYESITQEVHNLFRQRLGREAEDWELAVLADEMQVQYRNRNTEMITAARAAFFQAQGGGSGVMEVEVPDPVLRQQSFIEDRYGAEIGRLNQIGDTAQTNRLMIDAMTKGTRMVNAG